MDCVFDVGANRGQYARMLRTKVGYDGQIISFEPIPELVEELRQISASDSRWHIEGVALGREAGAAAFHIMADSEFSSLLRPRRDQPAIFGEMNKISRSIEVNLSTLAAEFRRYQEELGFKRPFLKMDTQGADLAVVEGAGDTLKHFVGVQTELAIRQLYDDGPGMASALRALAVLGFEPSAFVPNNEGHFPMLIELDCILFRRDRPALTPEP